MRRYLITWNVNGQIVTNDRYCANIRELTAIVEAFALEFPNAILVNVMLL